RWRASVRVIRVGAGGQLGAVRWFRRRRIARAERVGLGDEARVHVGPPRVGDDERRPVGRLLVATLDVRQNQRPAILVIETYLVDQRAVGGVGEDVGHRHTGVGRYRPSAVA